MSKKSLKSQWGRILIAITVVLIICILALLFSQLWFIRNYRRSVIDDSQHLSDLTMSGIDSALDQIYNTASTMLLDPTLNRFVYQSELEEGDSKIITIKEAIETVSSVVSVNDLIEKMFIYSAKSGYLIDSTNAYLDIEQMYPVIRFENMSARQWITKYLLNPYKQTFFRSTKINSRGSIVDVIPYAVSYPLINPGANEGKVIILIKESELQKYMKSLQLGSNGFYLLIENSTHRILSHSGNMQDATPQMVNRFLATDAVKSTEGEKFHITRSSGTASELTLISAISYKDLSQSINYLLISVALISFVVLTICLVFLLVVFFKNKKDWDRIKSITENSDGEVSYENIASTITSINKNDNESSTYLYDNIFRKFIERTVASSDLSAMFDNNERVKYAPNDKFILAKLIVLDDIDYINLNDLNFLKILVDRELEENFENSHYSYLDLDNQIWMLTWGANTDQIVTRFEMTIMKKIEKVSPFTLSLALSAVHDSLETLDNAPLECNVLTTILQANKTPGRVIQYISSPDKLQKAIFTKENEKKLINSTVQGQEKELKELFRDLYHENYETNKINAQAHDALLRQLYATAISYCQKQGVTNIPKQFAILSDAEEFFLSQCTTFSINKNTAEITLINDITSYIYKNFADPNLTLSTIAEHLKLKENYLYHFMLTRINQTFAQFLEEYRMNNAIEILKAHPYMQINEVAIKCGYPNPQTFRRVFKKHFGILPSDFKINKVL